MLIYKLYNRINACFITNDLIWFSKNILHVMNISENSRAHPYKCNVWGL